MLEGRGKIPSITIKMRPAFARVQGPLMRSHSVFQFGDRRSAAAFWSGALIIAVGVGLHLPMFLMARDMGYMLAGMPMDASGPS